MVLSGPSTSETHPGHREPCQTYRRLRAESVEKPKGCLREVLEEWKHTDGPRKCETCRGVTRKQANIRRNERRAKVAALKLGIQKKRRRQELNTVASATSLERAEKADDGNTLSPVQAQVLMTYQVDTLPQMQTQEPGIHQGDTAVKSEPPPPPSYSET